MRSALRWLWPPMVVAGMLVLALNEPFWAQDKTSGKGLDKAVYESLREVINHGAHLFNDRGDYAGCYRAYEAGLIAVKPFLAHRPDVQKSIDEGLEKARGQARVVDRAFTLRHVLRDVRLTVKTGTPSTDKEKKPATDKVSPPKDKATPPKDKARKDKATPPKDKAQAKKTLWDRLGGEKNVKKVVDDFAKIAGPDPAVNVTRNGKYPLDENKLKDLKKKLVAFVSSATGGPLKYTGKNMKDAHKGMGITNAEFDAAKVDLKKAMEKNNAQPADITALLGIVETTRKDIVEPPVKKKKEDKKKTDKKPAEKKEVKTQPPKTNVFGSLSGKVTVDGKPAPGQYVTLLATDSKSFSTYVHADGTYFFRTPIPMGQYRVIIEPGPKASEKLPALKITIPDRYRNPATSGLTVSVREGDQTFDLALKK